MLKVRQQILVAIKLGRIKIIIDKSWCLPFSVSIYSLKSIYFGLKNWHNMLEISLIKINIILTILSEED